MSARTMSHAGTFYPADPIEIEHQFKTFEKALQKVEELTPQALIVPHAGYIYSGFTAESAYRYLTTSQAKRAIVIGPSHRVAYTGLSISLQEYFETPLGNLSIDTAYAKTLMQKYNLDFEPQMHHEHSTEVQMPFIKYFASHMRVIEMVYGDFNPQQLSKIISDLLNDPDNLVIISTDLSHFYSEDNAKELDAICIKAIEEQRPDLLHQGCQACGKIGVEAMLLSAKTVGLHTRF